MHLRPPPLRLRYRHGVYIDLRGFPDWQPYAAAMVRIAREAAEEPDLLRSAPHATAVGRLDEVTAARDPILAFNCCAVQEV